MSAVAAGEANKGAPRRPWVVGVTGASGAIYARRLLQTLLDAADDVDLVISRSARVVLRDEEKADVDDPTWRSDLRRWLAVDDATLERVVWWREDDMAAGPSSGTYPARGLLVVPCSMGTLAAVAAGLTGNLVQRAVSVSLKEARPTVLLFREAPLSRVHLRNLLAAHEAGCTLLPAAPGFYHQPTDMMQLVDFVVGRVLDAVHVDHDLYRRWRS
jgi:flavin prenyltransferase